MVNFQEKRGDKSIRYATVQQSRSVVVYCNFFVVLKIVDYLTKNYLYNRYFKEYLSQNLRQSHNTFFWHLIQIPTGQINKEVLNA